MLPVSASHYVTWCQCSHALTDQDFISAQVLTWERDTVITRTRIIVHIGGVKPLLQTGHSGLDKFLQVGYGPQGCNRQADPRYRWRGHGIGYTGTFHGNKEICKVLYINITNLDDTSWVLGKMSDFTNTEQIGEDSY